MRVYFVKLIISGYPVWENKDFESFEQATAFLAEQRKAFTTGTYIKAFIVALNESDIMEKSGFELGKDYICMRNIETNLDIFVTLPLNLNWRNK